MRKKNNKIGCVCYWGFLLVPILLNLLIYAFFPSIWVVGINVLTVVGWAILVFVLVYFVNSKMIKKTIILRNIFQFLTTFFYIMALLAVIILIPINLRTYVIQHDTVLRVKEKGDLIMDYYKNKSSLPSSNDIESKYYHKFEYNKKLVGYDFDDLSLNTVVFSLFSNATAEDFTKSIEEIKIGYVYTISGQAEIVTKYNIEEFSFDCPE